MSTLDIREDESPIDAIQFANVAESDEDRHDIANMLQHHPDCYDNLMFIRAGDDYLTLRKSDIKNLIKALEKSLEIWGN